MDFSKAKVIATRRPGQPGTKKIRDPGLVAVRYYQDDDGNKAKTIEVEVKDGDRSRSK